MHALRLLNAYHIKSCILTPPTFVIQILMNVHSVHINVLRTVRIRLEATFVIVTLDLSELSMVMTVKVSVHALVSCVWCSVK